MVNKILQATTTQLHSNFGDGYKYYFENIEQNLTKPCFTVDVLIPSQRSKSPILYDRKMPMVIHYFSDNKKDTKADCYSKAEQIVECLEYLPFNNTILRGEDISWQINDAEVLQVFITYRFETQRVIEVIDGMETLSDPQITHT